MGDMVRSHVPHLFERRREGIPDPDYQDRGNNKQDFPGYRPAKTKPLDSAESRGVSQHEVY
jgi:hypothetical protein